MSQKNDMVAILLVSIVVTIIVAMFASNSNQSIERDNAYKSLLTYKNDPNIDNLRGVVNALDELHENDYKIKIITSNAIYNINEGLSDYCQKDECASYSQKIENYNNDLEALNRNISVVNRDDVEAMSFICPRIATTNNNGDIVYECALPLTATRAALIVDPETYKKYGDFLRATMYVESIGPISYEFNNYDPYRGYYKTTAMVPTYKSTGVSNFDINDANEKIKIINEELKSLKQSYANAEYIDWIKIFKSTSKNIIELFGAFKVPNERMWYENYLNKISNIEDEIQLENNINNIETLPSINPQSNIKKAPSFDCSNAKTKVEQFICSSDQLADDDRVVVEAYKNKVNKVTDKYLLETEQKKWRQEIRDLCQNEKCIHDAYSLRLLQLNQSNVKTNSLQKWSEKYPHDTVSDNKTIWNDPIVAALVRKIMPKRASDTISKYAVEGPIKYKNGLLLITGCEPHNCGAGRYVVVIDEERKNIWSVISFTDEKFGSLKSIECFSMEGDLNIPKLIEKDFNDAATGINIESLINNQNSCNKN